MPRMTYENRAEVVGLFHSAKDMQDAIDALETHGFDRADLSVMATETAIEEKLGHKYIPVRDLEDRPDVPTMAFFSRESLGAAEGGVLGIFMYIPAVLGGAAVVASGGSLAAAIAAAAVGVGAGGAIGGFLARLIDQQYVRQIEEHLAHGGLLLWVATRNEQHIKDAKTIMREHGAEDVHAHTLPSLE